MIFLCTGSSGFIGSHLVPALKKQGKVVEWDVEQGRDIFSHKFEKQVMQVDVIYHLAAMTNVDFSFNNSDYVQFINVLGTAHVIRLCSYYEKKLVYPSSAAIYHPELSPYAYSKWLAEKVVTSIKYGPVTVLRLFNVYGEGMTEESGSIMYRFLHDEKLEIYGDGEQTRDFINIKDVVSILVDARESKWNGKIVDVGSGEAYSVNYVAGLFAHFRGKKIYYKAPRREIKWSIADTAMLKTLYTKKLTMNLKKDIELLVQHETN